MNIQNENRPNWWVITTVVGCASLLACACCYVLGSLGLVTFLISGSPPTLRPVLAMTARPTAAISTSRPSFTPQPTVPTATPIPISVAATRTAKFQSIDVTNAVRTATAVVYAPTLQASGILAASLVEDPTQWTVEAVTTGLQPAFGPESGVLSPSATTSLPTYPTGIRARNFVVQVRFNNPNQFAWGYSLYLTDPNCYFIIASSRTWAYSSYWYGSTEGKLQNLDVSQGGSNLVQLVVFGESTIVYVNGIFVETFNSGLPDVMGGIYIRTGSFAGDVLPNVEYAFSDFTVWVLPEP